jgi:TRAP-type uncharacterized transport system substrate-binding protein
MKTNASGLRIGWGRYLLFAVIGFLVLTAAVTWLAFSMLRPNPPRQVAMATGPEGGTGAALGNRYREILARDGVDLRLVPSAGVVANAALLRDPKSGVSVAIIPGGITNEKESPRLVSLGTLFYEPLWMFYRVKRGDPRGPLRDMRIAIGAEGSGSQALTLKFLAPAGVIDKVSDTLLSILPAEASEKLLSGEIDGVVLLGGWESPSVQKLLAARDIKLLSIRHAEACVAIYPFLAKVILPAGIANMADNIPPDDVVLLAPKASLVVRNDLHPAIQYLLMEAALEIHSEPGVFRRPGEFPAAESIDLPLSEPAMQFYKTGRPFFQRHLPFWLAVLVQELLVLLIPLVALVYPVVRFAPEAFGWVMRRRVYSLYRELSLIGTETGSATVAQRKREDLLAQLDRLEERVMQLHVPASIEPLVYDLRLHSRIVRERLERP